MNEKLVSIAIGATALIGLFFSRKKCSLCNKSHFGCTSCFVCNELVCKYCGKDISSLGFCCKSHGDIDSALINEKSVKVFSENYKGKIAPYKISKTIHTSYYRNKDNAEYALRFIAAINDANIVQEVKFTKKTENDNNYKYSVWSGNGRI